MFTEVIDVGSKPKLTILPQVSAASCTKADFEAMKEMLGQNERTSILESRWILSNNACAIRKSNARSSARRAVFVGSTHFNLLVPDVHPRCDRLWLDGRKNHDPPEEIPDSKTSRNV